MIAKAIFGILTGGTMVGLAATSFDANAAAALVSYSTNQSMMLVGLGMVGLGMWGRKRYSKKNSRNGGQS